MNRIKFERWVENNERDLKKPFFRINLKDDNNSHVCYFCHVTIDPGSSYARSSLGNWYFVFDPFLNLFRLLPDVQSNPDPEGIIVCQHCFSVKDVDDLARCLKQQKITHEIINTKLYHRCLRTNHKKKLFQIQLFRKIYQRGVRSRIKE